MYVRMYACMYVCIYQSLAKSGHIYAIPTIKALLSPAISSLYPLSKQYVCVVVETGIADPTSRYRDRSFYQ